VLYGALAVWRLGARGRTRAHAPGVNPATTDA